MTNEQAATFAEMIQPHAEAVEEIKFALNLSKNSIVSHGWIVTYPGDIQTAYAFDVVDHPTEKGRKMATNARVGQPHKVTRFTKEDARRVAADCRNGKGEALIAVHWKDAAQAALASHENVIDFLNEALTKAA